VELNFKDNINLLSKLTLPKAWNAWLVLSSYYLSKLTKRPIQWGMPFSVSVEPTTSCNLRCPECPSGQRAFSRPTGMLEKDFFGEMINELHSTLLYLIFYFQGEPYLNPDFLEMVTYASQKGIYTATSTNAHYLDEKMSKMTVKSGLDRLIISIDGTDQATYASYRQGGELEKVIQGTRRIIDWKKKLKSKTPHVIFQFLVVKQNEKQIDEIYKLGKELGVDEVRLKTAQINDYEQGSELIPSVEKFSRYRLQPNGTYTIKSSLPDHCWKLYHSCVITWDGIVTPCCFDKDADHKMGTLRENSFKEIWHSNEYNDFRSKLLRSRKEIDICNNCTEGVKIWI